MNLMRLITRGLRRVGRPLRGVPRLRRLDEERLERAHARVAERLRDQGPRRSSLAVVLHVFYPELLPQMLRALSPLDEVGYDLYLTMPRAVRASDAVRACDGSARVVVFPNRGRDILPFVTIARHLHGCGYTHVLKLHTKRSPHRVDGAEWFESLISKLIPSDPAIVARLIKVLNEPKTGLVGPRDEFLSLTVNLAANESYLRRATRARAGFGAETGVFQGDLSHYGFFAGSMFWARLEALAPLFDVVRARDFEPEDGRNDGTYAHSLERMFSLVCELDGRALYAVGGGALEAITYESGVVPDWTDTFSQADHPTWSSRWSSRRG